MKKIALTFLLLPSLLAFGQKNDVTNSYQEYPIKSKLHIQKDITNVLNAQEAHNYLLAQFSENEKNDLKLLSEIESPNGKHYTFIQTYDGIEVYQALLKLNVDRSGKIVSIFNALQNIQVTHSSVTTDLIESSDLISSDKKVISKTPVWAIVDGQYVKCNRVQYSNAQGLIYEELFDQYASIYLLELTAHFAPQDTTAKALVFRPDPITKANTIYAGDYVDNNDATNSKLDAARDTVDIDITYDNGTFYLENDFVKLVTLSPPLLNPVTSSTPFFYYNRSESGFEDVNVIYHLTKQQKYIQSLGFTNLVNYQIAIDCHGFNGADNSVFNASTNPPSIIFGTGGVDDAEDADVIIHEYTHAIMHSATPNTNFGTERSAMDEAFGDYLAASYSSTYDSYQDLYVYNWDGHNEYWDGRMTTSSAQYPADLQFNLYADAPMWSSALMRIERNIGRDAATALALQAAYSFSSNMTMAQAAQIFIQTDASMNNGAYYGEICWTFKDKGMVNSCSVSRPDFMVGISPIKDDSKIVYTNSEQFASNSGSLNIYAATEFDLFVYDIQGRLIYSAPSQMNQISISPEQFKSGTYIYKVVSETESKTFKILKL